MERREPAVCHRWHSPRHIQRDAIAALNDPNSPRPAMASDSVVSFNPKIAAAYHLSTAHGAETKVRGAAGTGIRPPDGFELAFTNNPSLQPERSRSVEAGVDQGFASGRGLIEATWFHNTFDDLIVAVGSFAESSRYLTDNISNARAQGLELATTVRGRASGFDVQRTHRLHLSRQRNSRRRSRGRGTLSIPGRPPVAQPAAPSVGPRRERLPIDGHRVDPRWREGPGAGRRTVVWQLRRTIRRRGIQRLVKQAHHGRYRTDSKCSGGSKTSSTATTKRSSGSPRSAVVRWLGCGLLQAADLEFGYPGLPPVLRGVSMDIPAGGFVGILGPNGSGKTTLLRALAGVIRPVRGEVRLDNVSISQVPRRTLARRMAVVPQETHLAFDYTVLEVVMMGRYPHLGTFELEGPQDFAIAREALAATGTSPLEDRRFDTLSGGEKQRVIVAAALAQITAAQSDGILLLDEPTVALDLAYQLELGETAARAPAARPDCHCRVNPRSQLRRQLVPHAGVVERRVKYLPPVRPTKCSRRITSGYFTTSMPRSRDIRGRGESLSFRSAGRLQ